jgi:hypothetical protein
MDRITETANSGMYCREIFAFVLGFAPASLREERQLRQNKLSLKYCKIFCLRQYLSLCQPEWLVGAAFQPDYVKYQPEEPCSSCFPE